MYRYTGSQVHRYTGIYNTEEHLPWDSSKINEALRDAAFPSQGSFVGQYLSGGRGGAMVHATLSHTIPLRL